MRTTRLLLTAFALTACSSTTPGRRTDAAVSLNDAGMQIVCSPSDPGVCEGTSLKTCNSDGTGYTLTSCPGGCTNGTCVCGAGQRTCNGQTVQVCASDGTWHDLVTCAQGSICNGGSCDDIRCPDEMTGGGEFSLPNDAWPRFRHDNRNTGWNAVAVSDTPVQKWKVGPYGTAYLNGPLNGFASGPVVNQNNVVFLGAGDGDGKGNGDEMAGGYLYAFDNRGTLQWSFAGPRGYGFATPAVRTDGTSYYSTQDGYGYAVDMSGMQSWKYMFGFQDDCSPIVTSVGNVIYGSDSGSLFALDFNGTQVWMSDPNSGPGEVDAALAESCNGIVFAGGRNGWTAMDAKSGSVLWQVAAGGTYAALMSSPLVSLDGTMYGLDSGGTAIAIDPTGKTKWSTSIGPAGAGTSLAKVGNTLFAVTNDGMLKAVDAASGTMKWSQPVNNAPETYRVGGPVVDGNERLWFNSNDGWLYAFDQTGKQVARIQHSGMPSAAGTCCDAEMAIGYDGTLYVPSNDGYLYAYQ